MQLSLEKPQGWRLHNLSGQPVAVPDCPHGKKFLLISSRLLMMRRASLGHLDNFPVGAGGLLLGQPLLTGRVLQPPASLVGLC